VFCCPDFFGGRHLCTTAHGIRWMIGAIFVQFSQIIFLKIIKVVSTRCQILRLKCTKFNFGWSCNLPQQGLGNSSTGAVLQTLLGQVTALPRPLVGFKGPTSKERGGEGGSRGRGGVRSTFSTDLRRCCLVFIFCIYLVYLSICLSVCMSIWLLYVVIIFMCYQKW